MALQKLSDPMAFVSGAELWLLPDAKHSHWTRKIDWYLNFQAARALTQQAPTLDPGFLQLLQEEQLATPTTSANSEAPLMISTAHRLPARYVVQVLYHGKLKTWLKHVCLVWQQMDTPAARIFLPISETFNDCLEAWDQVEAGNVSVVMDSDQQKTTGI